MSPLQLPPPEALSDPPASAPSPASVAARLAAAAIPLEGSRGGFAGSLRTLQESAATPTAFACLRCQLIGRRRLTCSKAAACSDLPHSFALGPLLLVAWAATAVAFIVAAL